MQHPALRLVMVGLATTVLAACASAPKEISLIPTQTAEITSQDGAFTQPLQSQRVKPGCKGDCPTIKIDSLIFPGNRVLTDYVDEQLSHMTELDGLNTPHSSLRDFTEYFWQHAGNRDQLVAEAKARYLNSHITVLELNLWQYVTGSAHGMGETRFLNWDNDGNKAIKFNEIVPTNQLAAFNQRLQQAHQKWLLTQDSVIENPVEYSRIWPFQPSQNIALTDSGIVVKYNSYEIAPYSSGQPELHIAYPDLNGIVNPKYLPSASR